MELFGHKKCRDGCGSIIACSESERAANNTLRRSILTGPRHKCNSHLGRSEEQFRKSIIDEEGWVTQAELYIREINQRIRKSTIKWSLSQS